MGWIICSAEVTLTYIFNRCWCRDRVGRRYGDRRRHRRLTRRHQVSADIEHSAAVSFVAGGASGHRRVAWYIFRRGWSGKAFSDFFLINLKLRGRTPGSLSYSRQRHEWRHDPLSYIGCIMDITETLSKTNFTVLPSAIILIVGASVITLNVVGIARMHAIANRSNLKLKTRHKQPLASPLPT